MSAIGLVRGLTGVRTPSNLLYMNTNTAAHTAASDLVIRLVAQSMTADEAAAHVVERLMERPELAAKVFAGLVAA